MNNRVLLTGVSGSIGIHFLAHFMHHTNWHIVGVASFRHRGWSDRITHMLDAHPEWRDRFTLVVHDLTAPFSEFTKEKIGKVDYIVNLAALSDVHASIERPVEFIQNNVWSVTNMLEFAREVKPKCFIQFSTDEVYGPTDGKQVYDEWAPIVPSNPYAASKACQEAIAIGYWRTYNVPVVITNTMNNVGELQQSSKFPVMVQKAIMNGQEMTIHAEPNGEIGSRSYVHSRNVADAVLFIMKNTTPHLHEPLSVDKPDRYNIAGDRQLNNLEFAQLIAKLMGKELKYKLVDSHSARPGHDPHYGLSDTKLKQLGWTPPLSFEESLGNVIEFQEKNPEWIR